MLYKPGVTPHQGDFPKRRQPVQIVLAEDHIFVRELTAHFLSREPRFQVVAEAASGQETIQACQQHRPDLLILDLNLAGALSGREVIREVARLTLPTRVLVCSGSVDEAQITAVLRTGPHGFMEKTDSRAAFLEAVERVAAGESYYCARSARLLRELAAGAGAGAGMKPALKSVLTAREREVLVLIASGMSTKEVARRIGVSESTAATHRANLMQKLGAHNTAELVRRALADGLIAMS